MKIYKTCISLMVALGLVLSAGIWHLGANPAMACGFFGAFLIDLGTRPTWKRIGITVAASVGFALVYLLTNGPRGFVVASSATTKLYTNHASGILDAAGFLGLGSIMVLSVLIIWNGAKELHQPLIDALTVPIFSFFGGLILMGIFTKDTPTMHLDANLYAYDCLLGVTPGRVVAAWFRSSPWLSEEASFMYASLLVWSPLFYGWAMRKNKVKLNAVIAFVTAGMFGFLLYRICPAMGPLYLFGPDKFPNQLPELGAFVIAPFKSIGIDNAIPSMHMTWALLALVLAWNLGWIARAIGLAVVGLVGLATVGYGEHYFIDLVVAVPTIVFTYGISVGRFRLAAVGGVMAIAWTALLRFNALLSLGSVANWLLVLGTIASITLIWRRDTIAGNLTETAPVPPAGQSINAYN